MRFKQKLICICALLALCCSGTTQAATAGRVLRVAVDAPYPPFAMQDEHGHLSGFDVDIGYAICAELGYECDIQAVPFDEIIPRIVAGEIDLGIAGMGASAERKKLVDFTNRYFRSLSVFIEREGTLSSLTPDTIKGLRVGTQADTLQAHYLQKTYGDNIVLVTVATYDELYPLLRQGDVDLILVDGLAGYSYLKTPEGLGLETIGDAVDSGGVLDWASIAVSKDQPWLREAVNRAIDNLRRSGEYGRINRKYFDFNIY